MMEKWQRHTGSSDLALCIVQQIVPLVITSACTRYGMATMAAVPLKPLNQSTEKRYSFRSMFRLTLHLRTLLLQKVVTAPGARLKAALVSRVRLCTAHRACYFYSK